MTTPVGVSATSHFNASASVDKYTRISVTRQTLSYFFVIISMTSELLTLEKSLFMGFFPKFAKKSKNRKSLCTVHNF